MTHRQEVSKVLGKKHKSDKTKKRMNENQVENRRETALPADGGPTLPRQIWIGILVVLMVVFFWSYWPAWMALITAWLEQPDYSHGFLVIPFAACFLWFRRDQFPHVCGSYAWAGVIFLLISIALRVLSARYFIVALNHWSILLWAVSVCFLLGGWQLFRWALPAVLFLLFMVPLPYRAERIASVPLQQVATQISYWGLQCLGQPVITEGNTIVIASEVLQVEEACSGLRIFMGIVALAFAYIMFARRPIWEKIVLLFFIVPIALIANSTRIIATGLCYQYFSGDVARHFSHNFSGWVMIPFAALLFGLVLWYLGKLFKDVEVMDMATMIQQQGHGDHHPELAK